MSRRIAWLAAVVLLAGCASGYNRNSLFGGYWDKNGPGKLVEVGYNGNGYTHTENVGIYLFYRSAELAQQRGKPWLSIYPSISAAIRDVPVADARVHALAGKPFGKVYIVLRDGPAEGAVEAKAVMAQYADVIRAYNPAKAAEAKKR